MTLLDERETTYFPDLRDDLPPRRELRGLRFPKFKVTFVTQVGGGVAALSGVWMQFGTAIALMAGGAAAVVLGMLKEDDRI